MISVKKLTKTYRIAQPQEGRFAALRSLVRPQYAIRRAVDGIDFDIQDGEAVGYIGQNGAGKSTTIKMLSGILTPDSGSIEVNGLTPHIERKAHLQNIGVVFGQKTSLWWDVPVIDSLRILKEMYRIEDGRFKRNLEMFCGLLDLEPFLGQPVRQLSLGQRVRADLAAALMHDPHVLFLDEPTIGVDVVAKERLREFILKINQERKVTVLLTTHDVVDMEKLDPKVAKPAFVNVNDGTNEGLIYTGKNIFTVQYHPEACPGPQDSRYLFDRFIDMMKAKGGASHA